MTNAGLDEAQAGSLLREIPVTSDNADDTTLMAESKEKLKFLLMKMKEGWKSWLKTQDSKNKIMAFGPITPWQIDGETLETVLGFILGGSKITADGDFSH